MQRSPDKRDLQKAAARAKVRETLQSLHPRTSFDPRETEESTDSDIEENTIVEENAASLATADTPGEETPDLVVPSELSASRWNQTELEFATQPAINRDDLASPEWPYSATGSEHTGPETSVERFKTRNVVVNEAAQAARKALSDLAKGLQVSDLLEFIEGVGRARVLASRLSRAVASSPASAWLQSFIESSWFPKTKLLFELLIELRAVTEKAFISEEEYEDYCTEDRISLQRLALAKAKQMPAKNAAPELATLAGGEEAIGAPQMTSTMGMAAILNKIEEFSQKSRPRREPVEDFKSNDAAEKRPAKETKIFVFAQDYSSLDIRLHRFLTYEQAKKRNEGDLWKWVRKYHPEDCSTPPPMPKPKRKSMKGAEQPPEDPPEHVRAPRRTFQRNNFHALTEEEVEIASQIGYSSEEELEDAKDPVRKLEQFRHSRVLTINPPRRAGGPASLARDYGPLPPALFPDADWYAQLPPPWNVPPRAVESPRDLAFIHGGRSKTTVFNGALEQYDGWRRLFIFTVHQAAIGVTEKYAMLCERVDTSHPNIKALIPRGQIAWQEYAYLIFGLECAYGGKRNLQKYYLQEVDAFPTLSLTTGYEELNRVYNTMQNMIAAYQEMGASADIRSGQLYGVILEKVSTRLDDHYRLWLRTLGTNSPEGSLPLLSRFLGQRAGDLESRAYEITTIAKTKQTPPETQKKRVLFSAKPNQARATVLSAADDSDEEILEESEGDFYHQEDSVFKQMRGGAYHESLCELCNKEHWLKDCARFKSKTPTERREWLAAAKRCFRCLRRGHILRNCQSKIKCGQDSCNRDHHPLVHLPPMGSSDPAAKVQTQLEFDAALVADSENIYKVTQREQAKNTIALRVIPVKITNPVNGSEGLYNALLDDGSQTTIISWRIIRDLALQSKSFTYFMSGINDRKPKPREAYKTTVILSDLAGHLSREMGVKALRDPVGSYTPVDWSVAKHTWRHLQNLPILPTMPGGIDVLIGSDHADLIASREEILLGPDAPVARRTTLGWSVAGPTYEGSYVNIDAVCLLQQIRDGVKNAPRDDANVFLQIPSRPQKRDILDRDLNELVQLSWKIEESPQDEEWTQSREVQRAVQRLQGSLKYLQEGDVTRIQLGCLWKEGDPTLSNNYAYALQRLLNLEKSRIMKKDGVREAFHEKIAQLLERGYVRLVPRDESRPDLAYYLPAFPVLVNKPSAPIRIVLDGSARSGSPPKSLNDANLPGPNMIQDLVTVLHWFRLHPYAIMGDVKEMFMQVSLAPPDRRYHRFLYRKSPEEPIEEYEFLRHCFGNTGSPAVALFAVRQHAEARKEVFPLAYTAINKATLMDDTLFSCPTADEAAKLVRELRELYAEIGMHIHKFASNSDLVLQGVPYSDRLQQARLIDSVEGWTCPSTKALGIIWDTQTDSLLFSPEALGGHTFDEETRVTKRLILRQYARIFDPLGLLAPWLLTPKIILQKAWREKCGWDETISPDQSRAFVSWCQSAQDLTLLKFPRSLTPKADLGAPAEEELHVFVDASAIAYGAVVYLRTAGIPVHVALVLAKSRVGPLKEVSIPRLELMAAHLGTKLAGTVLDVLSATQKSPAITFWTDSTTVFHWIKNPTLPQKAFVAHRLKYILERSSPDNWRWLPTDKNPADLTTRATKLTDLSSAFWRQGPHFLKLPSTSWPVWFAPETSHSEVFTLTERSNATTPTLPTTPLINLDNYNSLQPLIGALARIFALADKLKKRSRDAHVEPSHTHKAWHFLIRQTQSEFMREELEQLQSSSSVRVSSRFSAFRPFLSPEGIICASTRLSYPQFLPPVLLPPEARLSSLVMNYLHSRELKHTGGPHRLLARSLRQFRILRGRAVAKTVIKDCLVCRRRFPTPMTQVEGMLHYTRAPDPDIRLPPFAYTDLDAAGPFLLKQARSQRKVWVLVAYSIHYKAVHFETLDRLDTNSFVLAFQRFCARRGTPIKVRSDNGGNFTKGSRVLMEAWQDAAMDEGIIKAKFPETEWTFSPPYTPHMNGAAERAVGMMKRTMERLVTPGLVNQEEFVTLLAISENLINDRPLGYVSDNPLDEAPLSPNSFLRSAEVLSTDFKPGPREVKGFGDRYKFIQHMMSQLWKRLLEDTWSNTARTRKGRESPNVEDGEIVLIADKTSYGKWIIGRVEKAHLGADHKVRLLDVKTKFGVLRRHVSQVAPLAKL